MKKKRKFLRKKKKKFSPIPLLFCAAAILAIDALFFLWLHFSTESTEPDISIELPTVQTAPTIESTAPLETESTAPLPTETIPPETGPQILPYFAQMAEQNPDMVGWIKIDNTKLDYPIMFTPDNEEKYLHKNFEGNFSVGGLPFISASCCLGPRSDNLIVYGHNMANGTMFNTLLKYEQINYWREHPIIHVSSLYEEKNTKSSPHFMTGSTRRRRKPSSSTNSSTPTVKRPTMKQFPITKNTRCTTRGSIPPMATS